MQLRLIRHTATAAAAVVLTLAGASAQASVQPGNYQDHVVPNTTTRQALDHQPSNSESGEHLVRTETAVPAGNYQDYVLPSTTRRTSRVQAESQQPIASHDVAMSGHGEHR